jgi:hypothetical protein
MSGFKVKLENNTEQITLKNTTIVANRLDSLTDIVEGTGEKIDGAILVYEASTDTYKLNASILEKDEEGNYVIQGGSF